MLTRFVEESGVFMGNKRDVNDEALYFRRINDWILSQAGVTWDNTYNMKFINRYFIENVCSVIDRRMSSIWISKYLGLKDSIRFGSIYNQTGKWGWKDPRNTLTLPIWKELFPDAKIVHIYRNPIDIAASLRAREYLLERQYEPTFRTRLSQYFLRNRFFFYQSSRVHSLLEGFKLWKEYVELALAADELYEDVMHIKYEDFLNNPSVVLEELAAHLQVTADRALMGSISAKIDKSRSFAFVEDRELLAFFQSVRDDELMVKLGYSAIV